MGLKLVSLGAAVLCLWLRFKSVDGLNHEPWGLTDWTLANRSWGGDLHGQSTLCPINLARRYTVTPLYINRVVFVLPAQHIEEVKRNCSRFCTESLALQNYWH